MKKLFLRNKNIYLLFLLGLLYALYWLLIIPIQFTGDSDGYLGVARLLTGHAPAGIPHIFRSPGYPILLVLTGVVWPGTFIPLLFIQALLAACVPIMIYYIVQPYGSFLAFITSLFSILTGICIAHISQIMTEPLFIFLLFYGLVLATRILREKEAASSKLFYWLAVIFACMNAVRPFVWLIFWSILALFFWYLRKQKNGWKNTFKAAGLFILFMFIWTIADDILFSHGARFSPLVSMRMHSDPLYKNYLYNIPFREAYFDQNKKAPKVQAAFLPIYRLVEKHIAEHQNELLSEKTIYPYALFGSYAHSPNKLVAQLFSDPNYKYANYIELALEHSTSKPQRQRLYYQVAKAMHYHWPHRWFQKIAHPLSLFAGPSHGNGANHFLLAYTSLQYYLPNPRANHYYSLINKKNGAATSFLFTTLKKMVRDNPELWSNTNGLFSQFSTNQTGLEWYIITHPNQSNAWEITVMLWDCLGYDKMSALLQQVAMETYIAYAQPLFLRLWETILMVGVGPGFIEFDHLGPRFGEIETYDYLESAQLSTQQKRELHATQKRYLPPYTYWRAPVKLGYFIFYLLKPLFLLTSCIALGILWANKQPIIIPLLLMMAYGVNIIVYGILFTALPRYTDPSILLPLIVTCMSFPTCLGIYRERQYKFI